MVRSVTSAAGAYFGLVFACGFALGAIRVLLTAPAVGETAAVLLELPIMIAISWFVCGFCLRLFGFAGRVAAALAMGAAAFAMLMVAETVLGLTLFGRSLEQQVTAYATTAGLIGLGGQVAFGLTPPLQALLWRSAATRASGSRGL